MCILYDLSWREPYVFRESWLLEWMKELKKQERIKESQVLSKLAIVELLKIGC